jgi:DNA invertase Pin-like site-specific DNA recombinase
MIEQPKRVLLYARVNTKTQAERKTCQSQITDCRRYADENGYEIVQGYIEEGVSGAASIDQRKQLQKCLD